MNERIKQLEVKLADIWKKIKGEEMVEIALADGEIVQAKKIEVGEEVYSVTDSETKPLENGKYEASTGQILTVEDGKISQIENTVAPSEGETIEQVVAKIEEAVSMSNQEVLTKMSELATENDDLKKQLSESKEEIESVKTTMSEALDALKEFGKSATEEASTKSKKAKTKMSSGETYAQRIEFLQKRNPIRNR